jgi:hypothetical protein
MKFTLFSKIPFEVPYPEILIESYCIQSNFYSNYDLILKNKDRSIQDVNKIGARAGKKSLERCAEILSKQTTILIFQLTLDEFLDESFKKQCELVAELEKDVFEKLLKVEGVGFSKITKILHTLYPQIIPMLDNPLYSQEINVDWKQENSSSIFIDYYQNLMANDNWENLTKLSEHFKGANLTKVRIFDILWWSYLKFLALKGKLASEGFGDIDWSSMK